MLMACKLAKEGYYGGDPEKILDAPVDIAMALLNYEAFLSDIVAAEMEGMNENR
jgi:hypothetical protein